MVVYFLWGLQSIDSKVFQWFDINHWNLKRNILGGSHGLVVMGRDSRSKGPGFKSRHHILDGHFCTYVCCKNCNDVCLKRLKINGKEVGVGPLFKKENILRQITLILRKNQRSTQNLLLLLKSSMTNLHRLGNWANTSLYLLLLQSPLTNLNRLKNWADTSLSILFLKSSMTNQIGLTIGPIQA